MANLNKVMLIGRLTRDPEVRTFTNGGKVCNFGFAVTGQRKKNQTTGEWEEEPCFLDCKAFNKENGRQLADLCEQYLKKGHQAFIEGHLIMEQWDDKTSGAKRSALKVIVDNVEFLQPKDASGGMGGAPRQAAAPRQAPAPAPASRKPPVGGYAADNAGYEESEPMESSEGEGGDDHIPF
jgi:single-strand DNA-binding protein